MIGTRIKLIRTARGMSMDMLVSRISGFVTKAAISKYESGLLNPSPKVLSIIAKALDVKPSALMFAPEIKVEFVAYRKNKSLAKAEQDRIESVLTEKLEEFTWLHDLVRQPNGNGIKIQTLPAKTLDDAEQAAMNFRELWNLGLDPIANVTNTLEDHSVFVIDVDASPKFDGLSAIAKDSEGSVKTAAVANSSGVCGNRQRLNLAHELGHLVLDVGSADEDDIENIAFRFGGALLAPAEVLYKEIGGKRHSVTLSELAFFKKQFGMSLQALVKRIRGLDIINQSLYSELFREISARGWRKEEPDELPREESVWLEKTVMRAYSEGLISSDRAQKLIGKTAVPIDNIGKQRAFLGLPLHERQKMLDEQSKKLADTYEVDEDWLNMEGDHGADE